jgi:anti-anti-sigma factor
MAYVPNTKSYASRRSNETTPGIFIHDDSHPRASVVHVFGEATFADTAAFESMIGGAIRIGRPVIADMCECSYMDCATIGVLVRAAKSLGDLFHIALPKHSQGYRMLELTGLVKALLVHESVDDALLNPKPVATLRSV